MKDILEENNRLKVEVEKFISDNMELVAVIRSLRKNAQEEADQHDRMVGELEKVYAERDEAREQLKEIEEYGTEEINAAIDLRQKLATALVERDEAIIKYTGEADELERQRNHAIAKCEEARRERDEARELAKEP
jgi:hypothetical protein